jgi:hypothetical protein
MVENPFYGTKNVDGLVTVALHAVIRLNTCSLSVLLPLVKIVLLLVASVGT